MLFLRLILVRDLIKKYWDSYYGNKPKVQCEGIGYGLTLNCDVHFLCL